MVSAPRGIIFDMDGVLVDSEPLWVRAELEVFGAVGLELREEDCLQTTGLRTDDVVAYWYTRRPWTAATPAVVEQRLVARVAELIRAEGVALPGVSSALAAARALTDRMALATSSPMPVIEAVLDRLELAGTFEVLHSAWSEPYGKPHPGVFLTTAERLGLAATACIVIEDSINGVVAAKAARMSCIAIPQVHDPRFVLADAVLPSLEHVTADVFNALGTR